MPPTPSSFSTHPQDEAFQNGLAKRTQVMGQPFVDKAFAGATEFTLPMQHHITRAAWGDVWQREGLDLKTRSLITVAALVTLAREDQLKGHLWRALDNGVTREELSELFTHLAFYAGWPNGIIAAKVAKAVYAERGES